MTITELAKRMRTAAKQSEDAHRYLVGMEVATESFDFIQLATPANVLALLDALEAKDKQIAEAEALAAQQGNIAVQLFEEVQNLRRNADDKAPELRAQLIEADGELEKLRQRIAELETRTELQPVYQLRDWHWYDTTKEIYEEALTRGDECRVLYTVPPAPVVDADDNFYSWFGREWHEHYQQNQYAPAVKQVLGVMAESTWKAGRAAMLQAGNSPVIPAGWIPCSERMPEKDGNYWGWWSESRRQGPVWFIKSDLQAQFQSSEITHWQPLPAPPEDGE